MKKLYYLIMLTVILSLVLTGCFLSNVGQVPTSEQSGISYLTKGTEAVPDEFPLYAGQTIPVGTVYVWDDGSNLTITYDTTDSGWVMTETHLAVATTLGGIPQTKKHNPIPGQFPYQCCYDETEEEWLFVQKPEDLDAECSAEWSTDPCLPTITYTIPLDDWEAGTELFIAAHAVVQKCETESFTYETILTWKRSSEEQVSSFSGYGAGWTPTDGFNIAVYDGTVWDGGTASQYFTDYSERTGVDWASWMYAYNDGGSYNGESDLRRFNATFEIPEYVASNITGATLKAPDYEDEDVIPINDNVYIFLNEILQFWGGTRVEGAAGFLTTFESMNGIPAIWIQEEASQGILDISDGWYIPGIFPDPDVAVFDSGINNLDVFTEENEFGGGMARLELILEYEQTTCETETAWADGARFTTQGNWATYFTVQVTGPVVETGYTPDAVLEGGARWRNFRTDGVGWELAVGDPDVIGTYNPGWNNLDFVYSGDYFFSPDINKFTFSYNATTGDQKVEADVSGGLFTQTQNNGVLGPLDYMQIDVAARNGHYVEFKNVELTVGAITYPLCDFVANNEWLTWQIKDFDLSGGFLITGEAELTGQAAGQEHSKIQILVGKLP